jgi:hypothetical protein
MSRKRDRGSWLHGMADHQDDEGHKADQLDAKHGKPHRHEGIRLHMTHMDQRLQDAGYQDED